MRFLVDECTGPAVAEWLRDQKHEVFSVYDEARGLNDDAIIQKAFTGKGVPIGVSFSSGLKMNGLLRK